MNYWGGAGRSFAGLPGPRVQGSSQGWADVIKTTKRKKRGPKAGKFPDVTFTKSSPGQATVPYNYQTPSSPYADVNLESALAQAKDAATWGPTRQKPVGYTIPKAQTQPNAAAQMQSGPAAAQESMAKKSANMPGMAMAAAGGAADIARDPRQQGGWGYLSKAGDVGMSVPNPLVQAIAMAAKMGGEVGGAYQEKQAMKHALRHRKRRVQQRIQTGDPYAAEAERRGRAQLSSQMKQARATAAAGSRPTDRAGLAMAVQNLERERAGQAVELSGQRGLQDALYRQPLRDERAQIEAEQAKIEPQFRGQLMKGLGALPSALYSQHMQAKQAQEKEAFARQSEMAKLGFRGEQVDTGKGRLRAIEERNRLYEEQMEKPTIRTGPGGGIYGITDEGAEELVPGMAPAPTPPKTVTVRSMDKDGNIYERRVTEEQAIQMGRQIVDRADSEEPSEYEVDWDKQKNIHEVMKNWPEMPAEQKAIYGPAIFENLVEAGTLRNPNFEGAIGETVNSIYTILAGLGQYANDSATDRMDALKQDNAFQRQWDNILKYHPTLSHSYDELQKQAEREKAERRAKTESEYRTKARETRQQMSKEGVGRFLGKW